MPDQTSVEKQPGRRGCTVVVADIDLDAAQTTIDRIEGDGGDGTAVALHVRDADAVHAAVDEAAWITGQELVVDGGFSCA